MITVIIQAGGQSKRMTRDKALVPFLGTPMIERSLDRFSTISAEIQVIHNQPESLNFLELNCYQDILPGRGALGGLYTALSIARTPLIGLIAVDLPFASPKLIQHLADQVVSNKLDACLPSTVHGLEPMHAVYRVETCLPLVKGVIEKDLWKMTAWHDQAKVGIIPPNDVLKITDCEYTFMNLNTPNDLKQAEDIARQEIEKGC